MSRRTINNQVISRSGDLCTKIVILDLFGQTEQTVISKNPPLRLTESDDGGKSYKYSEASPLLAPAIARQQAEAAGNTNDGSDPEIIFYYTVSLLFKDESGVIYRHDNKINHSSFSHGSEFFQGFCLYKIFFDDCCTEFEIRFQSDNYPGWVCKPIAPMHRQLSNIVNSLR